MSILADTNILLRRTQPGHPSHASAVNSVAKLLASGEPALFTLQNIAEFWNVMTRPMEKNGLGFSTTIAWREVDLIERLFTLLPDTPAVYAEWERLVVFHGVAGSKVHDAKLVAVMTVHGVRRLLTFNTADFTRYGIEAIGPDSIS